MNPPPDRVTTYLHALRELRLLVRAGRHNAPQTESLRAWLYLARRDLTVPEVAEVWRLIALEDGRG